jgi:CDP-glycerol glycerophosphotransferase (TagB/SpsB family)
MVKNNYHKEYKIVWLISGEPIELQNRIKNEFGIEIECIKKNSIKGMLNYCKSQIVFYTHGVYGDIKSSTGKKRINLWHGMPLKNIGLMDDKQIEDIASQDYLIATSKEYQKIMAKSFGIDKEKVLLTGQPRNDLLFEKTNYFDKENIDRKQLNKVYIWLPTYRQSIMGEIRTDGNADDKKVSLLNISSFNKLNEILKEKNEMIILNLHPMDILNRLEFSTYSNIKIYKSGELASLGVQLYPLIGSCDVLITDYSSVYIDFDILNKPIIFAMDDFDEYKNSRGFVFDGNIENYMPGTIVQTENEFLELIQSSKFIRKSSKIKLNEFKDNNSSKRITEYFFNT